MPFPPTDWGPWTTEEYDVGAPATSNHFERWFRNVVAACQGALGAPVIAPGWHPYDMVTAGDGSTGEIWSFAADGLVSTITSPNFEDGYEYRFMFNSISRGAGLVDDVTIEFYRETSAAWSGASSTIVSFSDSGDIISLIIEIPQPRVVSKICFALITTASNQSPVDGIYPGGQVVITCSNSTAQKIRNIRVQVGGGVNFDAGAAYMERRLTYK